jgi:hypothetical protein
LRARFLVTVTSLPPHDVNLSHQSEWNDAVVGRAIDFTFAGRFSHFRRHFKV